MGARLIRWAVCGLLVWPGFTGVVSAETTEDYINAKLTELCTDLAENWPEESFGLVLESLEKFTVGETREFVEDMTGSDGPLDPDVSDEEARRMARRIVEHRQVVLRGSKLYCRLREEGVLPLPGFSYPEHGEIIIFSRPQSTLDIRDEFEVEFEPKDCGKLFEFTLQVSGDDKDPSPPQMAVAYIFCEIDNEYKLIRAYRTEAESDSAWERFDKQR